MFGWNEQTKASPAEHARVIALKEERERDLVKSFSERLQSRAPDEDSEGLYDDAGALIRYLRARQWDLDKAEAMIRNTARWRKAFGLKRLRAGAETDLVERENATGKVYLRGYDLHSRPILYMKPGHENTFDDVGIVKHVVYNVERAVAAIEAVESKRLANGTFEHDSNPGGKMVLLVDFEDYSMTNNISVAVARSVVDVLQNHYPERLGQAFLIDPPWLFTGLWYTISPFLDPITYEKVQFVTEDGVARERRLGRTFKLEDLEAGVGGTDDREFDSFVYLNTHPPGKTVFGYELNAQLDMVGRQPSKQTSAEQWPLPPLAGASGTESAGRKRSNSGSGRKGSKSRIITPSAGFWRVSADPQVMKLSSKQERQDVRDLARALNQSGSKETELGAGYFDHAGMLIRFLRYYGRVSAAERAMRRTSAWRRQFMGAPKLSAKSMKDVDAQCAAGRMYVRGFSKSGSPILYVRPCAPGMSSHESFLRGLVYCLLRAVACVESSGGTPEDQIMVVIDLSGYSVCSRPSLRTLRAAWRITSDHFPLWIGQIFVANAPIRLQCTWAAMRPCVSQALARRVHWLDANSTSVQEHLDLERLETSVGGANADPFNAEVFLHQVVRDSVHGVEYDEQSATRQLREAT